MALFESSSLISGLVYVLMLTFYLFSKINVSLGLRNLHGDDQQTPFFIFGDSFLDAGNNNYINTTALDQANFWPYGISFFHIPTGRFSDGRLISDFLGMYLRFVLFNLLLIIGD